MRIRFIGLLGCMLGLLLVLPVSGQDANPTVAEPAAAAPAAPQGGSAPTWSVGPIDFSGAVDVYYTYNANHPGSMTTGLYNFNTQANQFDLSLLKFSMSHDTDPVGFTVDLGYGNTMEIYSSFDNDGGFNQYVEQAFVSWAPTNGNGFQLDFGKFVTSAGAELVESYLDWSYSRSILFAWTIPFYHSGVRVTLPSAGPVSLGFQLVNGWNNLRDNNSGKTIGATSAIDLGFGEWYLNYYAGPEASGTNTGWRHLIDTTLSLSPTDKVGAYINYDYGQDRSPGTLAVWQGIAGALHYQANDNWSFTGRGEWFQDRNGFSTGVVQKLKEVTFTGEYKLAEGLLTRAEYRHDWSNVPYFERGVLGAGVLSTKQDTFTIGVVAFFGPMR